jgi:hypothetical protein
VDYFQKTHRKPVLAGSRDAAQRLCQRTNGNATARSVARSGHGPLTLLVSRLQRQSNGSKGYFSRFSLAGVESNGEIIWCGVVRVRETF